jgi:hypothetical protein
MLAVVKRRTRASRDRTAVGLDNVLPPGSASCALGRRLADGRAQVIEIKIDVAYEKFCSLRNLRQLALKSAKNAVLSPKGPSQIV